MARLTAVQRKRLPARLFALPNGRYPINDPEHGRKALQLGAKHASPSELAQIKRKVHARYPSIGRK